MKKKTLLVLFLSLLAIAQWAPLVLDAAPRLIDLDFKNADLKDVLRALSVQAGVTMVIDDSVKGSVTLHLTRITFAEALN
ncbi:MAG: type II and III secretion system protein, partial [Firmicutes bacterium]|nr:type II and III secretion system protein [Bacillota bacterium]